MRRTIVIPLFIVAGLALFQVGNWLLHRRQTDPVSDSEVAVLHAASPDSRVQAYVLPLANPAYGPVHDTTVPDPKPDATAAVVYDLDAEQALWSRNGVLRIPVASLTKILSALVAHDLWTPEEVVPIASSSIAVDGLKQTLFLGERLTVQDLLKLMLIESSNDAAYALADHARAQGLDFVEEMNRKAWVLGMHDCAFRDPAGLDDMAYCTANDMVRLIRATMREAPDLWPILGSASATVTSIDGSITHVAHTTNELLGKIPGILGGKTGNTDGALGCLLLVVQSADGHDTLITVVLGSQQRFTDTQLLIQWASAAYGFH